jgi:HSF-type DNA-binding
MQQFNEEQINADGLPGALCSTFPQKLFAMSQQEFDEGEVINWLPHGLAFKVVDSDKFSEEVIPKYFKRKHNTIYQISYIPTKKMRADKSNLFS